MRPYFEKNSEALQKHLKVGACLSGKVFRLRPFQAWSLFGLIYVAPLLLILWLTLGWQTWYTSAALTATALIACAIAVARIQPLRTVLKRALRIVGFGFWVIGSVIVAGVVWLHLLVFDRLFLRSGRIDSLK